MSLGVVLYVATGILLCVLVLVSWRAQQGELSHRRLFRLAAAQHITLGALAALAMLNLALQLGWLVAP